MSPRLLLVAFLSAVVTVGCAKATLVDSDGGDDGGGDAAEDAGDDAIDASTCATQPCDILTQCGCEATPQTPVCDLDFQNLATGATKCRANNFDGDETTTCTMAATCAALHVCVGGRCRKYCDSDDDCPGAGGLCIVNLTYNNMDIPGAVTCTTDCVPTSTANPTCPAGWGCHVYYYDPDAMVTGDERYLTDCAAAPASGGGVGASCTTNANCQPGLDCVTLNPGGTQCRPTCMCQPGNCAAGSCPAGSGSCHSFAPEVIIGTQTYGSCFP